MPRFQRGPERRHSRRDLNESTPAGERREGGDRRRNAFISRLELCRGLPYEQVEAILERCPVQELQIGEVLLEPGQANHYLYLVLQGRLDVHLKALDSPLAYAIEAGECIGEMSIIDGQPTSAFVVATQPSEIMAVHENVFWSKIAPHQSAIRNLLRQLSERMRKQNEITLRALEQELRYKQLQKELSAAYEIQVGMLPAQDPLLGDYPAIDVHARMDVVKAVGGDLYDAFALDPRRICIAVGDVSGKGMPAALFMVRAMTLLHAEWARAGDLTASVARLNDSLCETNVTHMFVSMVVVVIDVVDGTLEFVNAGHPPMLVSHGGGPFEEIATPKGLIAGVLEETEYESGKFNLASGDRLVLYTDGVTEARNTQKQFYGFARLEQCLSRCDTDNATKVVETLFADVEAFSAQASQADDVTVLALTFRGRAE